MLGDDILFVKIAIYACGGSLATGGPVLDQELKW